MTAITATLEPQEVATLCVSSVGMTTMYIHQALVRSKSRTPGEQTGELTDTHGSLMTWLQAVPLLDSNHITYSNQYYLYLI